MLVHVSFIIQSATQIIRVKCDNNNSVSFSSNDQTLLITTLNEHNVGIPENQISLLINSHQHSSVYVTHKILGTKAESKVRGLRTFVAIWQILIRKLHRTSLNSMEK